MTTYAFLVWKTYMFLPNYANKFCDFTRVSIHNYDPYDVLSNNHKYFTFGSHA